MSARNHRWALLLGLGLSVQAGAEEPEVTGEPSYTVHFCQLNLTLWPDYPLRGIPLDLPNQAGMSPAVLEAWRTMEVAEFEVDEAIDVARAARDLPWNDACIEAGPNAVRDLAQARLQETWSPLEPSCGALPQGVLTWKDTELPPQMDQAWFELQDAMHACLAQKRQTLLEAIEDTRAVIADPDVRRALGHQAAVLQLWLDRPEEAACGFREVLEGTTESSDPRLLHDASLGLGAASVLLQVDGHPSACEVDLAGLAGDATVHLNHAALGHGTAEAEVALERWELALARYQGLADAFPEHRDLPRWLFRIAQIHMSTEDPDPEASAQAEQELVDRSGPGSPWWAQHRASLYPGDDRLLNLERSSSNFAKDQHIAAQESGDPEAYAQAAVLYQRHLESFTDAEDRHQLRWYLADALFHAKRYERALVEYEHLLDTPGHPHGDGARFLAMQCRRQLLVDRYGKVEARPDDAELVETRVSRAGMEIRVYALSDAHQAFIAAADAVVDTPCEDPVFVEPREDNLAALRYLPGQILFEHGWYPEARARFEVVIEEHPGKQEAEYATSLIIRTYQDEGDLEMLRGWMGRARSQFDLDGIGPGYPYSRSPEAIERTLRQQWIRQQAEQDWTCELMAPVVDGYLSGTPPAWGSEFGSAEPTTVPVGGAQPATAAWSEICEGTIFNMAAEAADADHLRAAWMFIAYLWEYPDSQYVRDALFNAANNLEKGGCPDLAKRLFELFVERFPEDDRSPGLLFRFATARAAVLDHRGAIDLYQLVLEHFPEGVNAPAAQWNLAVEFAGVGQHANAALAMEQYTDRWPEADDREAAMWWAAQFREKAEPAAAERAYVRYLAEYRGEHPDHSILAQESLWRSQRDADRPDAADRERQALLALWTELQQAEPRWTPRARRAVAQAATVDLETELAHFLATGIPGDDSVSFEDSVAMLDAWSTRVLETAKSIEHVEYAEAMATALAEAWAAVADVYPQHALNAVQGADVDAPAVTPEIRTRALAERCLQIGETAKRWTPWQERALTLLQARYPEDYPVVHEERRLE